MGDVEDVVAGHRVLTGPVADADAVAAKVCGRTRLPYRPLGDVAGPDADAATVPPGWEVGRDQP